MKPREITAGVTGGMLGSATGGWIGSGIGIAGFGTAIAGTVPVSVIGAAIGLKAGLAVLKRWSKESDPGNDVLRGRG